MQSAQAATNGSMGQFEHVFENLETKVAHHKFLCAKEGDRIVAAACLYDNPSYSNAHIEHIETAKNLRRTGLATLLREELFKYAKEEGRTLTSEGLTEDGKRSFLGRLRADEDAIVRGMGRV